MKLFEIKGQTPPWLIINGGAQDASCPMLAEAAGKNTHLE
jgi:hypothetical protein